jgi:hypothetical protein
VINFEALFVKCELIGRVRLRIYPNFPLQAFRTGFPSLLDQCHPFSERKSTTKRFVCNYHGCGKMFGRNEEKVRFPASFLLFYKDKFISPQRCLKITPLAMSIHATHFIVRPEKFVLMARLLSTVMVWQTDRFIKNLHQSFNLKPVRKKLDDKNVLVMLYFLQTLQVKFI